MKRIIIFIFIFLLCSLIYSQNSFVDYTYTNPAATATFMSGKGDASIQEDPDTYSDYLIRFSNLDNSKIGTDFLYDKATNKYRVESYNGEISSSVSSYSIWKQIYFEFKNAIVSDLEISDVSVLSSNVNNIYQNDDIISIGIMHYDYSKIKEDAIENNLLIETDGILFDNDQATESPYNINQAFLAAAMKDFIYLRPTTLEEAAEVMDIQTGRSVCLAGGTDLLGTMKDNIHNES